MSRAFDAGEGGDRLRRYVPIAPGRIGRDRTGLHRRSIPFRLDTIAHLLLLLWRPPVVFQLQRNAPSLLFRWPTTASAAIRYDNIASRRAINTAYFFACVHHPPPSVAHGLNGISFPHSPFLGHFYCLEILFISKQVDLINK